MTTAIDPLAGDLIPVRRPHFHLRGEEIHFFASPRPWDHLDEPERAVWGVLDGRASVEELRARYPGSGESALRRLVDRGLCELVPSRFPAGRRRVVVFEPHMDDAALSVGGTMWVRRHECEFTLVTIAGRTNYTRTYYLDREFFDVDRVAALRRAESELFVRLLGGRHLVLEGSEAPLRYHRGDWSLEWFRRHRWCVSSFIAHSPTPEEREAWIAPVGEVLRELGPDEVWAPLGVGTHVDHGLARDACLSALAAEPALVERGAVRLYQEALYAAQFPRHSASLVGALTRAGARLEPEVASIAPALADKLHLVSLFASQADLDVFGPHLKAAARTAGGGEGGLGEVFYRVLALPRRVDALSLHADEPILRRTARRLIPWIRRHRAAGRMRIVLKAPPGRWEPDMKFLLQTFPEAQFEVHVADAGLAGTEDFRPPRLVVRPVGRAGSAWAKRAGEIFLRRPAPTAILLGRERMRQGRILRAAYALSDAVVAPTLDHFVLALRLALESGDAGGAPPR